MGEDFSEIDCTEAQFENMWKRAAKHCQDCGRIMAEGAVVTRCIDCRLFYEDN